MEQLLRPVWAEINLDHLKHNLRQVRGAVAEKTKICAVVKANAYGHGAVQVARVAAREGADYLAVAALNEAIELRRAGIELPILILGYTPEEARAALFQYGLTQTIYTLEQARQLSRLAVQRQEKSRVHLKIDTGMTRLGFQTSLREVEEIKTVFSLPGLEVEGLYTHFALADETEKEPSYEQYDRVKALIRELKAGGLEIPLTHAANSAAIIDLPETALDMVRPGIMLYGFYPSPLVDHRRVSLKPVMSLKAKVAQVREVAPGQGVGYGWLYRTTDTRTIATLPIGYGDGFSRLLTGKVKLLISGREVPVVGRICMDQTMVDVTGLEVKEGDVVTIFYDDPEKGPTAGDLADRLGTISYEILCAVSRRVPRVYLENNVLLQVSDCLLE